jgi:hypothetical protein
MDFRVSAAALLWMTVLLGLPASAWSDDTATRYISDETAVTLRADKNMNATVAQLLKSGAKVELIEDDVPSGYSRVKVGPGHEGWVLTRYLSTEPAARERLAAVQAQLADEKAMVRKLQNDLLRQRAPAPVGGGAVRPAVDPSASAPASGPPPPPPTDAVVLGTSAGLFIAGLLTGLLIPLLRRAQPRKRRSLAS